MARTGTTFNPTCPPAPCTASRTVRPASQDAASSVVTRNRCPAPRTLWALKNLHVLQSWDWSPERAKAWSPSRTPLPRTPSSTRVDTTGLDLLDNDDDATDPRRSAGGGWTTPGTAPAPPPWSSAASQASSSVGSATLVPLRSNRSVVLVFDGDVARAVEYARRSAATWITMSLGGVGFSPALRAAIDAAIRDGILRC